MRWLRRRTLQHRSKKLAGLGVLLVFFISLSLPPIPNAYAARRAALTPDPVIEELMAQVSEATLTSYVGGLSGEWAVKIGGSPYTIATRYSKTTTELEKATQYVYEHFQALGLEVQYHEFELPGVGTRRNVIAEQDGVGEPGCIYILSAHLDSTSQVPYRTAPGADDNASGSSAVLAAADLLSQRPFRCTLRYALFTGEEQGLIGSWAYAKAASEKGEDIRGVLNLDMIGYNSTAQPEPVLELHTRRLGNNNGPDVGIAILFSAVISAYDLPLIPEIVQDGIQYSDHASFWNYSYPAIIAIEDNDDFSPYYHKDSDQVEMLDIGYYTSFTRAAVGAFAHLGGLLPDGYLSGKVTLAANGSPVTGAVLSAELDSNWIYSTTTGVDGQFLLELPEGAYTLEVIEPWYAPVPAVGVSISAGQTTTVDFQLEPLPTYTVSGTVTDAQTGQPLSASIHLPGLPLDPISTDPQDGTYELVLPAGNRSLMASSQAYFSQTQTVDLNGDTRLDFALSPRREYYLPQLRR